MHGIWLQLTNRQKLYICEPDKSLIFSGELKKEADSCGVAVRMNRFISMLI